MEDLKCTEAHLWPLWQPRLPWLHLAHRHVQGLGLHQAL